MRGKQGSVLLSRPIRSQKVDEGGRGRSSSRTARGPHSDAQYNGSENHLAHPAMSFAESSENRPRQISRVSGNEFGSAFFKVCGFDEQETDVESEKQRQLGQ
jgi:hypothetical protein